MQKRAPKVKTTRQRAMVKTEATGCSLISLRMGVQ